jgi:hypothetical protein
MPNSMLSLSIGYADLSLSRLLLRGISRHFQPGCSSGSVLIRFGRSTLIDWVGTNAGSEQRVRYHH